MADKSSIDWCTASLNPFGWGCYGPGGSPSAPRICENCYAHNMSKGPYPRCDKCAEFIPHWHPEDLDKARGWKKPREIFWQSMGDMWHPYTPSAEILQVLNVANETPQHVHLFLTKNPSRYLDFASYLPKEGFYGVTIRNQAEANKLLPVIMKLSARGFKIFLSMEPLYSSVDFMDVGIAVCRAFKESLFPGFKQIIMGGENGRSATHPLHINWARSIRDQCNDAGIPFFFKGWGEWKFAETPLMGLKYGQLSKQPKICQTTEDALIFFKVGKEVSGRLLDGREHNDLAWRV